MKRKLTPEERELNKERYKKDREERLSRPFVPRFDFGDKVYVTDQFRASGPFRVVAISNGCDCCDLYVGEIAYYQLEDSKQFHSDSYVHATLVEAEEELRSWKELREKYKPL